MKHLSEKDHQLLNLLQQNARCSVTELARDLGVSRSTAQQRLEALESGGVIEGYRLKLSQQFYQSQIQAYIMISVEPKCTESLVSQLEKLQEIAVLYSVSGRVDLLAMVRTSSTGRLDDVLDQIAGLEGVRSTESAITLKTKFDRR